ILLASRCWPPATTTRAEGHRPGAGRGRGGLTGPGGRGNETDPRAERPPPPATAGRGRAGDAGSSEGGGPTDGSGADQRPGRGGADPQAADIAGVPAGGAEEAGEAGRSRPGADRKVSG